MLREISLEGKTALITGGGTGIGFAIAAEMADAGANIVIVGRREEKLRKAAQKIGKKCSWHAGINIKKDYFDFTAEEFDKIMETQAKAPFMLSQTAAKYMKERKSGCILLISSLASVLGMHEIQAYTVAKSGMKGLARSLARDLGPYGIRVNSLNPGFVYTDMLKNTNLKTPGRLEEIQNRTPMRGFAKEKDLGMAAAFLASDAARFITGIDLVVDGGISSSFLI